MGNAYAWLVRRYQPRGPVVIRNMSKASGSEKLSYLTSTHRDYQKHAFKWRRCRDFIAGEDALRAHDLSIWSDGLATIVTNTVTLASSRVPSRSGFVDKCASAYILPTSPKMLPSEYSLYLFRGHYYPVVEPSKSSYIGQVFSKTPRIELPADAVKDLTLDINLKGTPLILFAKNILDEILSVGRVGVIVDHPPVDPAVQLTMTERSLLGARPYFATYRAEDILDWDEDRVGNRWQTVYIKLREEVRRPDGYDYNYRELVLAGEKYFQIKWARSNSKGEYRSEIIKPRQRDSNSLGHIPFYVFSPRGLGLAPEKPPLEDFITLVLEFYQANVEYANARYAVAQPTPFICGMPREDLDNLVLGGMNAIVTEKGKSEADAKYLEFTGQGLSTLDVALKGIEARLSRLGSRILMQDKASAESAEALRVRASGEEATLADIADSESRIMTAALNDALEMGYGDGKAEFELPKEYSDIKIDAAELKELRESVKANLITFKDYLRILRKAGKIGEDRTDEEIIAELESQKASEESSLEDKLMKATAAAKAVQVSA